MNVDDTVFVGNSAMQKSYNETIVQFIKCDHLNETADCEDPEEIDRIINKLTVLFTFLDTKFDGKNVNNPLLSQYDSSIMQSLNVADRKRIEVEFAT